MPRKYTYLVDVNTKDAKQAARDVRHLFEQELARVDVGGALGGGQAGGLNKALAGPIGQLQNLAKVSIAGYGAMQVKQAAEAMIDLGNETAKATRSFENLAGGAAKAQAMLQNIRAAAKGSLDDLQAIRISNRVLGLGFVQTSEQMKELVRIAATVGPAFTSTEDAMERIVFSASNLSTGRLDEIGISGDKVKKRFQELRLEMDDTQAMFQAILEVGGDVSDKLGGPTVTSVDRLKTVFANLGQTIAKTVTPAIENEAKKLADGIEGTQLFAQSLQILTDKQGALGPKAEELRGKMEELNTKVMTLQITTDEYVSSMRDLIAAYQDAKVAAEEYITTAGGGAGGFGTGTIGTGLAEGLNLLNPADRAKYAGALGKYTPPVTRAPAGNLPGSAYEDLRAAANATNKFIVEQNTQRYADEQDLISDTLDHLRTTLERNEEKRAAKAEQAWEKASREAEAAWSQAMAGIAGLPGMGRSQVTQDQMDLAKAGIPQRFADSFLREVEDTLVNGVQRANVDIGQIQALTAQSAGLDLGQVQGLDPKMLFKLFEQEYTSARLFALPEVQQNVGQFLDLGAVEKGLQQQQQAKAGSSFIDNLLKAQFGDQFDMTGVAQGISDGLTKALSPGKGGVDVATGAISQISGQFNKEDATKAFKGLGTDAGDLVFAGWDENIGDHPWAQALATAIKEDIMAAIEAANQEGGGQEE